MFMFDDYGKDELLLLIGEADIFSLVFGHIPVEGEYTLSPFREDHNPGCFFSVYNDKMYFVDFGSHPVSMDCFSAVKTFYNLTSFQETLDYIKVNLIYNKKELKVPQKTQKRVSYKMKSPNEVKIYIKTREMDFRDNLYWNPYKITMEHLKEDKVFAVQSIKIINSKGSTTIDNSNSYAYTDFKESRKKIYFPYSTKKRFITNCKPDDIGNLEDLPYAGETLIITKSYKDCRILRNLEILSVWNQNEGIIPSERILTELCHRFTKIIVFYDNDRAGIMAGKLMTEYINNLFSNKASQIYLPDSSLKDSAEVVKHKGEEYLIEFLKSNIVW